ncbi:MAG: RsmB/NOP family class I SAM-dependent RNA methyltransferase [Candidatus Thermoplasmatota archaeon]|nr:RsmB/NOP family class I SAM-dependent RNA methyltransferase [Candidatus Thermoplasmatota archaeon]
MEQEIAAQVIAKYLKKGNMARCLRDILPPAGLSKTQREEIAELVHDVVRWKKLYDHIIDTKGQVLSPQTYIQLAMEGAQSTASSYPFEYRYSCSPFVAQILQQYPDWADYLNETPPTTLCVNLNTTAPDQVMTLLHEEHLPAEHAILPTAIHTTSTSKYSPVVTQHHAHIQDENSQLIATLAASLGDSILDYCAGNGGKSLAMASITQNNKQLIAYEINADKRHTLHKRCLQYKAAVRVEDHLPDTQYDVVLVDAPCSGLGAARRNPEIKYIEDIDEYPPMQLNILQKAAHYVTSGGFLLYAVCTFTPEETATVIEQFIDKSSFTIHDITSLSDTTSFQQTRHGAFTSLPRGDIFYCSLLSNS